MKFDHEYSSIATNVDILCPFPGIICSNWKPERKSWKQSKQLAYLRLCVMTIWLLIQKQKTKTEKLN